MSMTMIRRLMATIPATIAEALPCAIAVAIYAPMPGKRYCWSPSVNASHTLKKNHPPDVDKRVFQNRFIAENRSATVHIFSHGLTPMAADTSLKSEGTDVSE